MTFIVGPFKENHPEDKLSISNKNTQLFIPDEISQFSNSYLLLICQVYSIDLKPEADLNTTAL